jgi:hypothetical protein
MRLERELFDTLSFSGMALLQAKDLTTGLSILIVG